MGAFSATRAEIQRKGCSLVPSMYIEFHSRYEQIGLDTKMRELQTELHDLQQHDEESTKELKGLFEKLGYKIN